MYFSCECPFKAKGYEDRLRCLNLITLETRRLKGDLIEVFKIFKGFDNLDPIMFFELSTAPTRGHSLKLVKQRCRLEIRKFSIAHRAVEMWNSWIIELLHVIRLIVLKIDSLHCCMVESLYKPF